MSADGRDQNWQLSIAMRRNIAIYGRRYELRPSDREFLGLLILDTYDLGRVASEWTPAKQEAMARTMGMVETKGVRLDKLEKMFTRLITLGLIDRNAGQGTYQLRPHVENWWHPATGQATTASGHPELALSAERPLSDNLSEVSREKALAGAPEAPAATAAGALDAPALFAKWREMVDQPEALAAWLKEHQPLPEIRQSVGASTSVEATEREKLSAEKSADVSGKFAESRSAKFADASGKFSESSAEKSAETEVAQPEGVEVSAKFADISAEKSADAIASLAFKDQKAKLAKAAEKSADARRWLEEVDKAKVMASGNQWAREWDSLLERDPGFVLRWLKPRLEKARSSRNPPPDEFGYIAMVARYEGKFRPK